MEIRIYNSAMKFQGVIENQRSVIWTRKYYEPGNFEIHMPITSDNLKLVVLNNMIWMRGSVEAGVIEDVSMQENSKKSEITVKGRFLSSYMDRRLIKSTFSFSGLTEVAMRQILTNAETIPLVELGTLNGFTDSVTFQATYKNLMSYETKLAKSASIGYRFRPDFDSKKIVFELFKGTDRTLSQGVNNRVIFSEEYCNLNDTTYRVNNQLEKTIAYVGGEGEGSARTYVSVGSGTGLNLREIFVDAKDIQSDGLTTTEYQNKLKQRGSDALTENAVSASFEAKTDPNVNFKYKTHYDLGDIVTVRKKSWGITSDLRITELQEVYENGGMSVVPTFGTPLPITIDWSES